MADIESYLDPRSAARVRRYDRQHASRLDPNRIPTYDHSVLRAGTDQACANFDFAVCLILTVIFVILWW